METPGAGGFDYAFGKLEQAIEDLVSGRGEIKRRLEIAIMTLSGIVPDDFPEGPMRQEYARLEEAMTWLPGEEVSGKARTTLEVMTEDEAANVARRLFSLYLDAADVRRGA